MVDCLFNRPCCLSLGSGLYYLYHFYRYWSMGFKQNCWMGLGYYQLRLVGRYRSRRYTDLSCTFIIPSKMENGSKPFCGSYDDFLGCTSWIVSTYTHGTSMVSILGTPNTKPIRFIVG